MGMIKDRKKFKTTKEQTFPTNPTGNINQLTNHFDFDKSTIKNNKTKHNKNEKHRNNPQ